jgi:hypothetical protein
VRPAPTKGIVDDGEIVGRERDLVPGTGLDQRDDVIVELQEPLA